MSASKTFVSTGFWLMKSEPEEYSLEDLASDGIGKWDGVRNYQARNYMQSMRAGDLAYFYYSNCPRPGIYGTMRIRKEAFPDITAIDKKSKYYDSRTSEDNNPWYCVGLELEKVYGVPLLLQDIKALPLGSCPLTTKGNRLSVMPISIEQNEILQRRLSAINIASRIDYDSNNAEEEPIHFNKKQKFMDDHLKSKINK